MSVGLRDQGALKACVGLVRRFARVTESIKAAPLEFEFVLDEVIRSELLDRGSVDLRGEALLDRQFGSFQLQD